MFETEKKALESYLSDLNGDIAVQYSIAGSSSLLASSKLAQQYFILPGDFSNNPFDETSENELSRAGAQALDSETNNKNKQIVYVDSTAALPFRASSVDLCLLHHTLEYSPNPHRLLRDSKDILVSGGHLLILGFNPYSFWGARKLASSAKPPWGYSNVSVYKMRDWLSLLDFQLCGGMMLYYSPPFQNQKLRERFSLLEKAGDRWWPMLAGVYLLVARKRDFASTVIGLSERVRKRPFIGVAEPVAKNNLVN